jgi:hypothetical protein
MVFFSIELNVVLFRQNDENSNDVLSLKIHGSAMENERYLLPFKI